jgi:hypothetical protein
MNTFGVEIYDDEGKYCTFYTVRWLDTELSETDKFFEKFRNDERLKGPLKELAVFLESVIANKYGAREDFFRFENMANALPPSGEYKVEKVNISYNNFPLRLYCLRISDSLVILFNGGEKTAATAQRGKTSMAFIEANKFAKRILEAIKLKDIIISKDQRQLKYFNGSREINL